MVAEAASLWRERLVNRTFCGFCLCLMQSRFFGNGRMEENLKDWYQKDEQEILKAVSYTHLDVYKRQAMIPMFSL